MSEQEGGIPSEIFAMAQEVAMAGVIHAVAKAYRAGLKQGIEVGRKSMREAILKAAEAPAPGLHEEPIVVRDEPRFDYKRGHAVAVNRAPRGSVRNAIILALTAKPGSSEQEVGELAHQFDPLVSPRSVGGELRRLKGRIYRVDRGMWFLTGEKLQPQLPTVGETAELQSPAVPKPSATQEESDAPETAIAA